MKKKNVIQYKLGRKVTVSLFLFGFMINSFSVLSRNDFNLRQKKK